MALWRHMRHRTWSTSVRIMDCCLRAPRHYLKQRWQIIEISWHSHEGNKTSIVQDIYTQYGFEITNLRSPPHITGLNELNPCKESNTVLLAPNSKKHNTLMVLFCWGYRQVSIINRTKSQHSDVFRLVLQLFSPNPNETEDVTGTVPHDDVIK